MTPTTTADRRRGLLTAGAFLFAQSLLAGAASIVPQEPEAARQQTGAPTPESLPRLVRQLESNDRRTAAIEAITRFGAEALPVLDAAIADETPRARTAVLDALRAARHGAAIRAAKKAFGLPDAPITLIADYSASTVSVADQDGRIGRQWKDLTGVWDAKLTEQATLLVTSFNDCRVVELDPSGREVWSFDDLKNPYEADRLPNGNTLIADAFNGRLIEVNRAKKIVWSYAGLIRPFDADRLPNGNTLIADVMKDRVIEVSPAAEIVWEVKNLPNVHDADRLANGNTLVTLRSAGRVIEIDRDSRIVWELTGLASPCDADRLANGHTLVAEAGQVREFDAAGAVVRTVEAEWAVEATRY